MGTKHFTVDARTILQLGRDSIKSHTTALSELVKNSYDADANNVIVEIINNEKSSIIRISDDGFGMSEKVIDDNWLRIGFSGKKIFKTSEKGRRKTGEKGIGRIAADRLGSILELKSKSKTDSPQGLIVDWDKFDVDNLSLSDVEIEVIENPRPKLPNNGITGTEIIVSNLRQEWTEDNIYQLKAELSTLLSPFQQKSDFTIDLRTNIISGDLENLKIDSSFLDAAEVSLEVEYDGKQKQLVYYIEDRKYNVTKLEKIEISQLLSDLKLDSDSLSLPFGPFRIKLLFFTRDAVALKRSNFHKIGEFRQALDEFQGIKIYRDGIAVKPYGFTDSPFSDWLELADRKARNPAGVSRSSYSITPNQIVGAVFITRDENPNLRDSSAREGLVENEYYRILKDVAIKSIQVLESHRHSMAIDPTNAVDKTGKISRRGKKSKTDKIVTISQNFSSIGKKIKTVSSAVRLTNLDTNNRFSNALEDVATKIEKDSKNLVEVSEELLNENRVLGGLATLGISSAVFGHEIQSVVSLLDQAADNVIGLLKGESLKRRDIIFQEIEKTVKYSSMINGWGSFFLSRVSLEKRKAPKRHKIHEIINEAIDGLTPAFEASSISMVIELDKIIAKVYPMNIEAIFFNVMTNAYKACKLTSSNRVVSVKLFNESFKDTDGFVIKVADSGPGIAKEFALKIWEPLFTTKGGKSREIGEGTGLGLTIVDSVVTELNGKIDVNLRDLDGLGGAVFSVWLPKK